MLFYLWNILAENGLDDIVSKGTDKKPMLELSDILTIALMMVVVFIVMRSTRRKTVNSRNKNRSNAKELVGRKLEENPNVTINRLQELMAALADMSREINGELDTRTAKLEILLAKADSQIAEYEKKLKKLQASQALTNLGTGKPPLIERHNSGIQEIKDEIDKITSRMPEIESTIAPPPVKEAVPELEPKPDTNNAGLDRPANSVNDQIIKLAKDGIPLAEISRATGRPSGEIELILNLNGIKFR